MNPVGAAFAELSEEMRKVNLQTRLMLFSLAFLDLVLSPFSRLGRSKRR